MCPRKSIRFNPNGSRASVRNVPVASRRERSAPAASISGRKTVR
jgi:hypothetical protein